MPMPVFNENDYLVFIEISDIISIYKDEKTRKIVITASCGEYYIPSTIDQIGLIMARHGFYQINSGRIVNLGSIKWYVSGKVSVDGEVHIVSRRRRKGLNEALNL